MFNALQAAAVLAAAEAVARSTLLDPAERAAMLGDLAAAIPTRCASPNSAAAVLSAIQRQMERTDDSHDTPETGTRAAEGLEEQAQEPRPVHRKGAGRRQRAAAAADQAPDRAEE